MQQNVNNNNNNNIDNTDDSSFVKWEKPLSYRLSQMELQLKQTTTKKAGGTSLSNSLPNISSINRKKQFISIQREHPPTSVDKSSFLQTVNIVNNKTKHNNNNNDDDDHNDNDKEKNKTEEEIHKLNDNNNKEIKSATNNHQLPEIPTLNFNQIIINNQNQNVEMSNIKNNIILQNENDKNNIHNHRDNNNNNDNNNDNNDDDDNDNKTENEKNDDLEDVISEIIEEGNLNIKDNINHFNTEINVSTIFDELLEASKRSFIQKFDLNLLNLSPRFRNNTQNFNSLNININPQLYYSSPPSPSSSSSSSSSSSPSSPSSASSFLNTFQSPRSLNQFNALMMTMNSNNNNNNNPQNENKLRNTNHHHHHHHHDHDDDDEQTSNKKKNNNNNNSKEKNTKRMDIISDIIEEIVNRNKEIDTSNRTSVHLNNNNNNNHHHNNDVKFGNKNKNNNTQKFSHHSLNFNANQLIYQPTNVDLSINTNPLIASKHFLDKRKSSYKSKMERRISYRYEQLEVILKELCNNSESQEIPISNPSPPSLSSSDHHHHHHHQQHDINDEGDNINIIDNDITKNEIKEEKNEIEEVKLRAAYIRSSKNRNHITNNNNHHHHHDINDQKMNQQNQDQEYRKRKSSSVRYSNSLAELTNESDLPLSSLTNLSLSDYSYDQSYHHHHNRHQSHRLSLSSSGRSISSRSSLHTRSISPRSFSNYYNHHYQQQQNVKRSSHQFSDRNKFDSVSSIFDSSIIRSFDDDDDDDDDNHNNNDDDDDDESDDSDDDDSDDDDENESDDENNCATKRKSEKKNHSSVEGTG